MATKIQILDYKKRSNNTGFQYNMINFNNVDASLTSSYWEVVSSSEISIDGSQTSTKYIAPVCGVLTDDKQYEVELTVSDYSGSNDVGFSTVGTNGTSIGITSTVRRSSNGTTSGAFTCNENQALRIFAESGVAATVKAKLIQRQSMLVNESVFGELEVGSSDDFPLALSFSIAEARDLNSRTGSYSKTFKIPATKNNNRVLKMAYYERSFIDDNKISVKKPCRILVDDLYALTGQLQITAVSKASQPLYYSCVFYGNNVDWAASIDTKLLRDLAVLDGSNGSGWDNLNFKGANTGVGLEVNEPSIVSTWDTDNATHKTPTGGAQTTNTSPVIYPIVGYGETNVGGDPYEIQLFKTAYVVTGGSVNKTGYQGWWNNGNAYPNPDPSCDWRPAIFIYDIVKAIFQQEGYTVSSNFMETNFFKKLLMLLPNFVHNDPDTRVSDNSTKGSWGGGVNSYFDNFTFISSSLSASTDWWPSQVLKWQSGAGNITFDDNSAMYNNTTGNFTIQEFGFYDLQYNNIGVWLNSVCGGTSTSNECDYLKIMIEVNTVGATSWTNIGEGFAFNGNAAENFYSCPAPPNGSNFRSFTFEDTKIEGHWLNKGDRVRFKIKARAGHGNSGSQTIGWNMDVFGGGSPTNSYLGGGTTSGSGYVSITHHGEKVEYGQTYDLKGVIDNESTQMNFLKGVIHAFNLQFTTDVASKVVYIEPFNDFYKTRNEAIDWTDKLDLSKAQEDKWIDAGLKKEMIFKYKEDSNDKVVEHRGNAYFDGIKDNFPYREFLSDDFEVGTTVFENPFFAGNYNSGDGMTSGFGAWAVANTPTRANLWGLCDSGALPTSGSSCRPPKGYNFVPRLLNYVKDNCNGGNFSGHYIARVENFGFISGSFNHEFIYSGQQTGAEYEILARACSYDDNTNSFDIMQPLTYAAKSQTPYNCSSATWGAKTYYKGLYQNYYQSMIEMAKANPRIKVCYINLKLTDINELDLRKLVYIDGNYYRINRIIDYKPNSNETTKVELVLWDFVATWPVKPSWTNNS